MNNLLSPILGKLERELKTLSQHVHTEEVVRTNTTYLESLVEGNLVRSMIQELLGTPNLMKEIAERSYEHVNHFDKIVLVDNPDPNGYRLTLHYWDGVYDGNTRKQELIHNHRFSFWSHIYKGKLHSENFEELPTEDPQEKSLNRFVYSPSITGNIHTCQFDKKAQLMKVDDLKISQGQVYYMNYKTIHRIILPEEGDTLCTFVLRGPRERDYTNTYNTFYPERGIDVNTPMMTTGMLESKLENILRG